MNTFKKKSLYAAVLAGLGALGAAGTANAVHLNPDGLGQVLIYPYYTTRTAAGASFNTLMSVVNSTNQTKLVKVRFLEGRNSREVLDFNLFLSPNDVFTGVVVPTAAGAALVTNDNSCVTPSDLFSGTGARAGLNNFKNFQYSAPNGDSGPTDLDRTREGYFEVIEMGVVTDATVTGYAVHKAGVPNNCPALDAYDPGSGAVAPNVFPGNFLVPPSGGLSGRANVISAGTGANYAYDATAFDAWSNVVAYTATGQVTPRLGQAAPFVSNVFVGAGANISGQTGNVNAVWANGANAFSATIMRNTVLNEYVLDAGTVSQTDWVLTFPTKREYVSAGVGPAAAPFASNFNMTSATAGGSCDPYGFAVYNREEGTTGVAPNVILPSPLPPVSVVSGSGTCWEASVVPFQGTSLLGSVNTSFPVPQLLTFVGGATTTAGPATSPGLPATNGPNGWMLISYNGATQRLTPISATIGSGAGSAPIAGIHVGLPVISMAFTNFNKAGVVSQYGQVSQARYTRNIQ
jgi:hypothetical protein